MAAVGAAFIVLVGVLAAVGLFGLYYFVRAEHDQQSTMDRPAAEQAARRDRPDRDAY